MAAKIDILTGYLDEKGVAYEVVEHSERFTAASEARAAGTDPDDAAKDVVLRSGEEYVLAVIPASDQLDLRKAADLLGEEGELRLASEADLAQRFPEFELGALPPFGPILNVEQIVDRRLLEHERVLCSGGDHRHSVRIDPNEMVRVSGATVGDLAKDSDTASRW
jgi:Ala-tRNA(Pro) deacylase